MGSLNTNATFIYSLKYSTCQFNEQRNYRAAAEIEIEILWYNFTLTARCSDPGIPNNGAKDGENFRSRANVTFRCNPPLELIGSRVIFCQDGKWSGSTPTCSSKYRLALVVKVQCKRHFKQVAM